MLLRDVATLEPVARVRDDESIVYALEFSPDGERLLVTPLADRFFVCDTRPLRERLAGR